MARSMQNRHMDQLLDHLEENRSLIIIIYSIIELKFKFNFYLIHSPLCDILVTFLAVGLSENSRSRLNNGRLITEHNLCYISLFYVCPRMYVRKLFDVWKVIQS